MPSLGMNFLYFFLSMPKQHTKYFGLYLIDKTTWLSDKRIGYV